MFFGKSREEELDTKDKILVEVISTLKNENGVRKVKNIYSRNAEKLPRNLYWCKRWDEYTKKFLNPEDQENFMVPYFGRMDMMNDPEEFIIYNEYFGPKVQKKGMSKIKYSIMQIGRIINLCLLLIIPILFLSVPPTLLTYTVENIVFFAIALYIFIVGASTYWAYSCASIFYGISLSEINPEEDSALIRTYCSDRDTHICKGVCIEYSFYELNADKVCVVPVVYKHKSRKEIINLLGRNIYKIGLGVLFMKEPTTNAINNYGEFDGFLPAYKEKEWRIIQKGRYRDFLNPRIIHDDSENKDKLNFEKRYIRGKEICKMPFPAAIYYVGLDKNEVDELTQMVEKYDKAVPIKKIEIGENI